MANKHRWVWPEELSRLSDWLTTKQLRDLVGREATKGTKYGRIVKFHDEQQGLVVDAVVERRAATEEETGKYAYRLVSASSARLYFKQLIIKNKDNWKYIAPEVDLTINPAISAERVQPVLMVKTGYEPNFKDLIHELGGGWNRLNECWLFGDEREFDAVIEELKKYYGLSSEGRKYIIKLGFESLVPTLIKYTRVKAFGRDVVFRSKRWEFMKAGNQVWFEGEPDSSMALHIWNVPSEVYEKEIKVWGQYVTDVKVSREGDLPSKHLNQRFEGQQLTLLKNISSILWSSKEIDMPSPGISISSWLLSIN